MLNPRYSIYWSCLQPFNYVSSQFSFSFPAIFAKIRGIVAQKLIPHPSSIAQLNAATSLAFRYVLSFINPRKNREFMFNTKGKLNATATNGCSNNLISTSQMRLNDSSLRLTRIP